MILFLISPVTMAIFIAYLVYPLTITIKKCVKLPYWLSALLTEIILLLMLCIFLFITAQSVLTQLFAFKVRMDDISFLEGYDSVMLNFIKEKSLAAFDILFSKVTAIISDVFQYVIEGMVFAIALFFALIESHKSRTWFFIYVPQAYREEWKNYFVKGTKLFSYFLFVEFQLLVITFLLLSIGLNLLGFEQAIHKAFLISLADSLPFFGIGLFLLPMSGYYMLIGKVYFGGMIILLYIFIQLTRQLTESMLWASTFHLRTVHTFFISAASILLFGFYGILLSPLLFFFAVRLKDQQSH